MDLDLSKDQQMVKSAVREFLDKECPKEVVREIAASETGHSEALWRKMAELGWMGMAIPEKYGGLGGASPDFVELAAMLEEMGYGLVPSAFFSTIVLGGLPILNVGTESQKELFLPAIAEGRVKFALAVSEPHMSFDASAIETRAEIHGEGYRITGKKRFVENGQIADYVICVTRTGDQGAPEENVTLFIVDGKSPGLSIRAIPTIGLERQCEIEFQGVVVPKKNVLGQEGGGWSVLQDILEKAKVFRSAQMLGGIEACLGITNAYVKKRVQYGRTIGSFQVVQHSLADVWMDAASSRDVVYKAASMMNFGVPCHTMASVAKTWTGTAFVRVAKICVELHGALGVTQECDISLYYRQARSWNTSFGSAESELAKIGERLAG